MSLIIPQLIEILTVIIPAACLNRDVIDIYLSYHVIYCVNNVMTHVVLK